MTLPYREHDTPLSPQEIVDIVTSLLEDKKAEKILILNITEKASFADFLVIASGNVARQIAAMADHIVRTLKGYGINGAVEGLPQGDWVLVDLGSVVVHLFRPEIRERYNIEKMWAS